MSNSDIDLSHLGNTLLEIYRQMKVYLSESSLEDDSTPLPIIQWMAQDGQIHIVGFNRTTADLAEVVSYLREQHGAPIAVGFSSDARFKSFSKDVTEEQAKKYINEYNRGQMHQDFENGDMTIKEALITVLNIPGSSYSIMSEYTYDDSGSLVFAEPTETFNHVGLVSDSLAHAFVSLN